MNEDVIQYLQDFQGQPVEIVANCQVEWDKRRGVLYVHSKDTGATIVRISGLPSARNSVRLADGQIDVRTDEKHASVPIF